MARPKLKAQTMHNRQATDLQINAKVAIAIVEDPYSRVGEMITVTRSIRDDILAGMLARQQIDNAQYTAGRHYQRCAEKCEIGGVQAIDPSKEAVDGGRMREAITDHQIKAFKYMADAHALLGPDMSRMMICVLTRHIGIREFAESQGLHTSYGWKETGKAFRLGLEKLAILWGYAMKGSCKSPANHL